MPTNIQTPSQVMLTDTHAYKHSDTHTSHAY